MWTSTDHSSDHYSGTTSPLWPGGRGQENTAVSKGIPVTMQEGMVRASITDHTFKWSALTHRIDFRMAGKLLTPAAQKSSPNAFIAPSGRRHRGSTDDNQVHVCVCVCVIMVTVRC